MVLAAGAKLTAALLNGELGVKLAKTSDKTVNNSSTYSADTQLSFPVAANSRYVFFCNFSYSAHTSADVKFAFSGPSGFATYATPDGLPTTTSGSTDAMDRGIADFTTAGGTPGGGRGTGAGNGCMAKPAGFLTTSATAGTVTLNFAQLAAHASDAVLYAGSSILIFKV